MARVPEHFIQDVLSRVDIVPLVQSYLSLKKQGVNFGACCPFHKEKTPSFTVSPTKQFYHCFGCGAHGDAISFVSKVEGLSFLEALEKLASQQGLSMPESTRSTFEVSYAPDYELLTKVRTYYCQQLRHHPAAKEAIAYLKARGLTGQVAKAFGIGFSPPGWSNVVEQFKTEHDALQRNGLILPGKQGRPYDRFRNRIMFPILDHKGRTIGFGARALGDEQPKYLNSPETPLFHKGRQFYGLYEALQTRQSWQALTIVEGYLDVIALSQHGYAGAIATLGTALTAHHAKLLFKYTKELILCFDGDSAGQQAASKAMDTLLPEMRAGREARFIFLPAKHDPDSYIREQGLDGFKCLMNQADQFVDFFFKQVSTGLSTASLSQKAEILEHARTKLQQLPQGMYRTLLEARLQDLIQQLSSTKPVKPVADSNTGTMTPAVKAALMLVTCPALVAHVPKGMAQDWLEQPVEGMALLRFVIQQLAQATSSEDLISLCQAGGIDLAPYDHYLQALAGLSRAGITEEFTGAVHRILEIGRQVLTEKLLEKAKNGELSEEEKQKLKELLM